MSPTKTRKSAKADTTKSKKTTATAKAKKSASPVKSKPVAKAVIAKPKSATKATTTKLKSAAKSAATRLKSATAKPRAAAKSAATRLKSAVKSAATRLKSAVKSAPAKAPKSAAPAKAPKSAAPAKAPKPAAPAKAPKPAAPAKAPKPAKNDSRETLPSIRRPEDYDKIYSGSDTPPWEIDRPQGVFLELAKAGELKGRVVDMGCGTGEHVLMAAQMGFDATGVDIAKAALERARGKASERGLKANFIHWDACELGKLDERFDTVLDCALFHNFEDAERPRYVDGLKQVLAPGGRCFLMCFNEFQPGTDGPRRVTQAEIRSSFADGWTVESIEPSKMEISFAPGSVQVWLTKLTRV